MTTTRFNIEESPSGRFCSFRNMLAAEPKQGDEDAKDNVIRAQTRALILEAYKAAYQDRRSKLKTRHKQIIIENRRKRAPHLIIRQLTRSREKSPALLQREKDIPGKTNYFGFNVTNLLPHQFIPWGVKDDKRPDGWAAARIRRAMMKYRLIRMAPSSALTQFWSAQCKVLYDECCMCTPLVRGPTISEDGVLRLAGPNLPKIMHLLNAKNNAMDLLQPHGVAQLTVVHTAAQRGYTDLVRELLNFWTEHPRESKHQKYSFTLLKELLVRLLEMRRKKVLVRETDRELHLMVTELGVPFDTFCEELGKLRDDDLTLRDLLMIFGHPLVLRKDAAGNTPLHYAAEGGYLLLCQLLLEHGAKINAQNKSGETPLHFAISSMHEDVCQELVRNKAKVQLGRYVSLPLINGVNLLGSFVNAPDGNAICELMPTFQYRSNVLMDVLVDSKPHVHVWSALKNKIHLTNGAKSATVAPELVPEVNGRAHRQHNARDIEEGMHTRVDALWSSPMLHDRKPREVVFFRTAPGNALMKPHMLCALLIGTHVAASDVTRARKRYQKGKIFHLLIQQMPSAAVAAMNSFRTPLFRCCLQRGSRDHNQRWVLDARIQTARERHNALITKMKSTPEPNPRSRRRRRKLNALEQYLRRKALFVWKLLMYLRRLFSVQSVFTDTAADTANKNSIICEPKGIVYEYVYDNAELRGGTSATLALIIETECKELMLHPWVSKLLDHKWNSFAKQTFRTEFHIYFVFFASVFFAIYVHVGDTYLGMPSGGYRTNIFTAKGTWIEYVRDVARLVYGCINAYYTFEEISSYRERGSIRAYFKDGWNFFDWILIICIWFLFAMDIMCVTSTATVEDSSDFTYVAFQESLYNVSLWRYYDLRTTLMAIVGPLIFLKWIQFARGNKVLGPFVRMIFKMFKDIFVFLTVFCLFLCGFAFAFFILQLETCRTYFTSVTTVLQVSLGAWDWDIFYEGGPLAMFIFIVYVVLGTIMLLNLLIAMLGNTYDKIWEDRLLFFELERAKATLSIQSSIDGDVYDEKYWCQRLYVLEDDTPIEGIPLQKF